MLWFEESFSRVRLNWFYQFLLMIYFYMNFISGTPLLRIFQALLMVQTQAHQHSTTILGEPGSPKRDVLQWKARKEERLF